MSKLKETKTSKILAGIIGITLSLVVFVGVGALSASAQGLSATELVELLISLGIIAPDKAEQARQAVRGTTPPPSGFQFTRDLTVGSRGVDVMRLQELLNRDLQTQVAASGPGSPGNETTYFGTLTRGAVVKFQRLNGVTPTVGYVGPKTRGALNALLAVQPPPPVSPVPPPPVSPVPPPPTGTGLAVAKPDQPAGTIAPENAARVAFTKFILTAGTDGDVAVDSVIVERGGLGANANFAGVVLLDQDGRQLGLAKTFGSDNRATVGERVTIPRGTAKTFTLAGNMAADNDARDGQLVNLRLVGINTTAALSGTPLPIEGITRTINSTLAIGAVTNERGPSDPNGAQSKNVGTTNFVFSAIKVTAGSAEKTRFHQIRWNQASSAGASDLANVVTIVDGTSYPTTISADGKYYLSTFGPGIVVDKGNSVEILVRADIVGGSGRTAAFNVEKTTDLYVTGEEFLFGITPPTSGTGFSGGSIWYAGSTVTIDKGSLTFENAVSVPAQNIAANLAGVPLGGFVIDVKGEPISVGSMSFNIATTGGGAAPTGTFTQVTVVDANGRAVAGPSDASSANTARVTFSDTVIFPVGRATYKIIGKVHSSFPNNGTAQLSTSPGGSSAPNFSTITGQVTNQTVTPSPTSSVSLNTMTVKGPAITLTVLGDPAAQTVVAGAQQFVFAKYSFSGVDSGEDLKFRNMPLAFHAHGGSTATNLTNCNLYDEGTTQLTTGSNSINPSSQSSSTTFTLDVDFVIPKGTAKIVSLKCNISSGATGSYSWGYDDAQGPTIIGLTSNQSATLTEFDSSGPKMTLSAGGALTVSLDSSAPSYAVVAAGTTGNTVGVLRVRADTEQIRLNNITLQNTTSLAAASSSVDDISKITLWDGASKVGEGVFNTSSSTLKLSVGTCSGCGAFLIPKDTDKLLTVKLDLASQGISTPGIPGALLAVDYDGGTTETEGTGVESGTRITTSGSDSAASGLRVFKSHPTIAVLAQPSGSKLTSGRIDLFRFSVTAHGNGPVGIYKFTVRIATTSATAQSDMIDKLNIYAYTDSAFSSPVSGLQNDGAMMDVDVDLSNEIWQVGSTTTKYNRPWVTSATDIDVFAMDSSAASTTVVVPAGSTRYFVVRGTATLAGSTYSVSTQLQGDATAAGLRNTAILFSGQASTSFLATSTFLDGGPRGGAFATSTHDNDLIWRPFSTTTAQSASANDYTNGYGIPGLPTGNTQAWVLAQ